MIQCRVKHSQELALCHVSMTLAFVHFSHLMHLKLMYQGFTNSHVELVQVKEHKQDVPFLPVPCVTLNIPSQRQLCSVI